MLRYLDKVTHRLAHFFGIALGYSEAKLEEGKYIVTYFVCNHCGQRDFIKKSKINGEN